ncbi:MAG: hypothetical protein IPK79_11450 [Vampirovibrionales bacterium]|nr:hypothetical protein [Vampirovibrionales bacterium]
MVLLQTVIWLCGWGVCFLACPVLTYLALSGAYHAFAGDALMHPFWTPAALLSVSVFVGGAVSREMADRFGIGRDGMTFLPLTLASQLGFAWLAYVNALQAGGAFEPLSVALALPLVGMAGVLLAPTVSLFSK